MQADLVYVVDDDADIRASLARLLRSVGMDAACFATIAAFTQAPRADRCACLLLDVRLQGAQNAGAHLCRPGADGGGAARRLTHTHV